MDCPGSYGWSSIRPVPMTWVVAWRGCPVGADLRRSVRCHKWPSVEPVRAPCSTGSDANTQAAGAADGASLGDLERGRLEAEVESLADGTAAANADAW